MYILNIAKAVKKMSIKDFIFENYYKRKKNILACKQINTRTSDPRSVKEHYRSFIRKKNTKSAKIITHQQKSNILKTF